MTPESNSGAQPQHAPPAAYVEDRARPAVTVVNVPDRRPGQPAFVELHNFIAPVDPSGRVFQRCEIRAFAPEDAIRLGETLVHEGTLAKTGVHLP